MSGGSIPSFDSTTYRAHHKFHSRIGAQATVLRKRPPRVEAEREAERSVARPPRMETLRQYSVQRVKAWTHPQPDNVARKRVDFGVAHDAIGKVGVATVPGIELAEAATQPLLRIGNPTQGVRSEPFAIGGSLTVFAAMLLFGWLVVRREHTARVLRASAVPAE